ncbi:hsp90-like protein [Crassisporium funariophilum]|nr:hsp90-like protein [Crassisporium funariophilum]
MPLNYSKWDQLELSDDSDIEVHPNVDKKSYIRVKQRDIHEERDVRKEKIKHLHAQIDCNQVLLPRIKEIYATLTDPSSSLPAPVFFSSLIHRLQTKPSRECPQGNDPTKLEQTYDGMLLSLLKMVAEKSNDKVKESDISETEKEAWFTKELSAEMLIHVKQLGATIEQHKKELEVEEAEQKKHITSDDLHEGFENKYVPPKPAPPPVPHAKKEKKKETVPEVEVLNPASTTSSTSALTSEEENEQSLPQLTPSLEAFSTIPVGSYDKSFEFIQQHRDVYVAGASNALLVAAFTSQSEGKSKYAKQCIHQSLLLKYCEELGPDGVGMFFKKMLSSDKGAVKVFVDDVENTYWHLVERVRLLKDQPTEAREQIQLLPENPSQTISFNVPNGPPPENLVLEGSEADLDIEEVKKALQFRWNIFQGFPTELQEALKAGGLDDVNKVLGEMEVPVAEAVVANLNMAGIVNFAVGGIQNERGKEIV